MMKKILIAIIVLLVALVAVIATRPEKFRITRRAMIAAPPSAVFAQINDFHKWNEWSPWAKLDPNAKNTFDGAASGLGAKFSWAGNSDVGEGMMTITESKPNERVVIQLDFKKPFEATSTSEFRLKAEGDGTAVSWTMAGTNNFIGKAVSLFMDCDKMVGGQFEKGLANLRSTVEAKAK